LITSDDDNGIIDIKRALDSAFTIKDLGLARYVLGIEVSRYPHDTFLKQRKYILDILQDADLMGVKPTRFPLPRGLKLSLDKGDVLPDPESYRRIIGKYYEARHILRHTTP